MFIYLDIFPLSIMSESVSIQDLEKLCADGDAGAMYQLGMKYLSGEDVAKSTAKGRKYLTDSAKAGNTDAMMALADHYKESKEENRSAFVEHWLRQAILAGCDAAILKLADYYYLGDGDSNMKGALLYLEHVKRSEEGTCEREIGFLVMMFENGWLDSGWKFYAELLEVLADNGVRAAKHMLRREDIPEPTDDYDYETLLAETFEIPETVEEEDEAKPARPMRRWGRSTVGKRALTSLLYDMGIEFSKTSNGIIKTKKGKEIEPEIQKLIDRGYKFKYSYKTDKWTIMDKTGKE